MKLKNKDELPNDMKDSNKGNETNAHDQDHSGRDLEVWSIICEELEHDIAAS
ncbi:hypothetical protein AMTR_s00148p00015710 [Amborella trichopoda]|uniref:Uncharacterized protein n=1 Tax=Amborella trichopoda TaxID=13333 RepID=W1PKY8_AMBTC|nr:hypothetical protein AMTR_s00148p00015710 [Amborella trichopoda]